MLSFERLKELKAEFEQMRKYNDRHYMSTITEDDVLEALDEAIARQSVESEEVAEAIDELMFGSWQFYKDDYPITLRDKTIDIAITALQAYQPWVSVEDRLPDGDVASVLIHTNKGGVSEGQYYPCIKSWKQFRWSVENADVTHWKPLPEPPKGE